MYESSPAKKWGFLFIPLCVLCAFLVSFAVKNLAAFYGICFKPASKYKNQVMKLSINNPCHENWDAMTPNEKGAFCLSCQKTVVDFSKKTIDEIKNFFAEVPKTESVCGRFEEDQLTDITFDHFHNNFKKWHYFQKTAVIVFFVFGLSLFGNAQTRVKDEIIMGKVAYVPQHTAKVKCVKDTTHHTRPIKGKVKVAERPKKEKVKPERPLMGDVMVEDRSNTK
jgi:hypothetical protein